MSKIPNTVNKDGKLYVRKTIGGKQVWRICEPPTISRVEEVLLEIEAVQYPLAERAAAELYLKTRAGIIGYESFKNALEKTGK